MTDLNKLREFEAELDVELARRPTLSAAGAIVECIGAVNLALSNKETSSLGRMLEVGLQVALPQLFRIQGSDQFDPTSVVPDLMFMGHYYYIRELLYYTYNAPGSFDWTFSPERVEIKFRDMSIRKQFVQSMNSGVLASLEHTEHRGTIARELATLLQGADEWGSGPHIDRAFELILTEANLRLESRFEMLGGESSEVLFPAYPYASLYKVYRYLLAKALYHRYHAEANSIWPTFQFPRPDLVREITFATDVDSSQVDSILKDLSYSEENRGLPPMYFGLVELPGAAELLMIPDRIVESDGLVQALRVQATRSPQWFLGRVSEELGNRFTKAVGKEFEKAGFTVRRNVSLARIDPTAPDIDIVVISPEPTLGYYVFLCETKGALPGLWAKDYLRTLRPDSLPKAFKQVRRVAETVGDGDGANFLLDLALRAVETPVTEGLLVMNGLIITSQNSGMFFSDETDQTTMIDYQTLGHLLRRCDGDVVYLLDAFKGLAEWFGQDATIALSVTVGNRTVEYEAQTFGPDSFIPFRRNLWKTDGSDVRVGQEFIEAGGSPFDVLEGQSAPKADTAESTTIADGDRGDERV